MMMMDGTFTYWLQRTESPVPPPFHLQIPPWLSATI